MCRTTTPPSVAGPDAHQHAPKWDAAEGPQPSARPSGSPHRVRRIHTPPAITESSVSIEPDTTDVMNLLHEPLSQRAEQRTDFLRRLVQIDSTPSKEGAVQEAIATEMQSLGLSVEELPVREDVVRARAPKGMNFHPVGGPNLLGTLPGSGSGSGRSLLLNGHCDTVPLGDESRWTVPPLSGEIRDGNLWGRGACDMKAGVAAAIYAIAAVRDAGLSLAGDVAFLSTVGEESGSPGAIAFAAEGRHYDAAIVTEPTELDVVPSHAGSAHVQVTIHGLGAHASVRDIGVSAIKKFCGLVEALEAFEAQRNAQLDDPLYAQVENKIPINVGLVRGGTWAAAVPEELVCHVRIGVLASEDFEQVKHSFEEFVHSWASEDSWLSSHQPTIDWSGPQVPGSSVDPSSSLISLLERAAATGCQSPPNVRGVTYGADMVHLINAGIPTAIFGPGSIHRAHRIDEYVPLDEVDQAARSLAVMIHDWCSVSG